MKKYILIIFLVISSLHSQSRIIFSLNPGESIYNSENSMKLMSDKKINWLPGLSMAYERENVFGYFLHVEYNLIYRKIDNVIQFTRTSPGPGYFIEYYGADFILSIHSIDIAVNNKINDWASFSIGPTISLVYRSFVVDDMPGLGEQSAPQNLDDRLASLCLGLNGSISAEVPFSNGNEYVFFFTGLKLRYIHSIWFDDRGRNVGNYYQSFLFSQVNIGLGYRY